MPGLRKTSILTLVLAILGAGPMLTACEEEGPAEKVGEEIDRATEETRDKIEDAGDKVEDKTD